jgi:hypothetical protein
MRISAARLAGSRYSHSHVMRVVPRDMSVELETIETDAGECGVEVERDAARRSQARSSFGHES